MNGAVLKYTVIQDNPFNFPRAKAAPVCQPAFSFINSRRGSPFEWKMSLLYGRDAWLKNFERSYAE